MLLSNRLLFYHNLGLESGPNFQISDGSTNLRTCLAASMERKVEFTHLKRAIAYDGTGNNPEISVNRELGEDSILYANLFTDEYKKKNKDWKTKPSREGLIDESYLDAFNLALARDHCLESIGNLTLITRRLNAKLGNSPFPERQVVLGEHSILKLNKEICDHDTWDVNEIHTRAEGLIEDVCRIWPSLDVFKQRNS